MQEIKNTVGEKKDRVYHLEWTYSEFVDFAINRPEGRFKSSRRKGNASWYGTETFEEAVNLAKHGWDSGLEQLNVEDGTLAQSGIEYETNIFGCTPHIQNHLLGLPDSMVNYVDITDYQREELTIYVILNYSAYYSDKEIFRFTLNMIQLVNEYQSKYNVKLVGRFNSKMGGVDHIEDVIIKDTDERFVINSIACALHPGFYRRLMFAHKEATSFCEGGYGMSQDTCKVENDLKKSHKSGKAILLPAIGETDNGTIVSHMIRTISE